jgi:hypothetical protein
MAMEWKWKSSDSVWYYFNLLKLKKKWNNVWNVNEWYIFLQLRHKIVVMVANVFHWYCVENSLR